MKDGGARLYSCFRKNKMMFQKEVNSARRKNETLEITVKDENGNMLTEEQEVKRRWNEYFDKLLPNNELNKLKDLSNKNRTQTRQLLQ